MTGARNVREAGFAAAEWVVGLGLVVLPLVMVVASAAPWLARQTAARLIAQEAARTVALAENWEDGAAAARRLGETIAANHGIPADEWEIVRIDTDPPDLGLVRGVDVVIEARIKVPALSVPGIGAVADLWGTVRHVEHVDDFRSFP